MNMKANKQTNKYPASRGGHKHRTQNYTSLPRRRKARPRKRNTKANRRARRILKFGSKGKEDLCFFSSSPFWLALCKVSLFSRLFHRKSSLALRNLSVHNRCRWCWVSLWHCGRAVVGGRSRLRRHLSSSPFHSLAHSPFILSFIHSFVRSFNHYPFGYRSLPGHRSLAPSLPRSLADWPVGGLVG